jgi:hypothetical protein
VWACSCRPAAQTGHQWRVLHERVIIRDLDQADVVGLAWRPLSLIPLLGAPKCLFPAKEIDGLEMLRTMVFDGDRKRRYPDIQVLLPQPFRLAVRHDFDAGQQLANSIAIQHCRAHDVLAP